MTRYDDKFFNYVDSGALSSAGVFSRLLMPVLNVSSILDVGCGRGGWLAAWKDAGCTRILGLDGGYVDRSSLKIPATAFRVQDLNVPFDLGERFDMVQSLEVAEHLRPESSQDFVESLVRHADVVLFSAAVPGQGGTMHTNERHMEFWRGLFARHGYDAFDFVRPRVANSKGVEPWYRYNSMIYASNAGRQRLPAAVTASLVPAHEKIVEGGSMTWKLRRAVVGILPRTMVNRLAEANALIKR